MRYLLAVLIGLNLVGCVNTTTIPLSQDTFQVTARTAQACGPGEAEVVATRQAAIEVIRRGHDRYIIVGGQAQQSVVGSTPVAVQRTYGGGAVVSGGAPIVSNGQGLVVKILADGDPATANALSARQVLGPNWQQISAKNAFTCL